MLYIPVNNNELFAWHGIDFSIWIHVYQFFFKSWKTYTDCDYISLLETQKVTAVQLIPEVLQSGFVFITYRTHTITSTDQNTELVFQGSE